MYRIMGGNGEVRGEAGMKNDMYRKAIAEHVKNVLRGRERWGLKHRLGKMWAQLPAGKLELSLPAAYRGRRATRAGRAMPTPAAAIGELDVVVQDVM